MRLPSWMKIDPSVFEGDGDPIQVATSGGKTSALLAYLYSIYGTGTVAYDFANTGREDPGTYTFLRRLSDNIPLRYWEVRKPPELGGRPSEMGFEEVSFDSMDRTGEPIKVVLESLAEYRRIQKDMLPVGMNPVLRICTAYAKVRMLDHIADSRDGWYDSWSKAVGLRADEPSRVAKLNARSTLRKRALAPLAACGITNCMVEMFWDEQEFNLDISPKMGNCTLCFLKDEADLAEIMLTGTDPDGNNWEWWKALDDRFQIFGRDSVRYRQIHKEATTRMEIRESLHQIQPFPQRPEWMEPRRFTLLKRQEQRILRDGIRRVPCSCESAELMTDEFIANAQESLFLP